MADKVNLPTEEKTRKIAEERRKADEDREAVEKKHLRERRFSKGRSVFGGSVV